MERQALISAQPRAAYAQAGASGSGQAATVGVLLALAGVAWIATGFRMAGMDAGPGTDPGVFGFFISTWAVMMAAMMFPATAPMVAAFHDLPRDGQAAGAARSAQATTLFVAAYLVVWSAAGLAAYAALTAARALDDGLFAWDRAGRWAVVAVLLLAAIYQLTRAKRACLCRCRDRRAFLLEGWRDGNDGALSLGFTHGVWCLGCCWALIAALFALGAMSIAWMVLISALIAAERLLPWRKLATTSAAVGFAAIAIGVALAPTQVPALTIPGSPAAMRAMGMSPGMGTSAGMHQGPSSVRGARPHARPSKTPQSMGSMSH
jgi:predicted metal-binding membrane protein